MLSSNYSTRKVCHLCEAVKYGAGPPFDDFGAGACHRNTSRDHNSYMLGFATPPPLSLIPGFQLCMLVCDPMHCLHLGVLQWAVGNALVLLSGEGRWGVFEGQRKHKLDKSLRVAYSEFQPWCRCRAISTSQPVFTANSVNRGESPNSFPEFKGKASNTRWVTMWLCNVLYHIGPRTEAALFWGLCEMLHIMHVFPGPWLTGRVAQRFARACRVALLSYGCLARAAKADCLPLWGVKPKHHQLDHLGEVVARTHMHPGYAWAFCDEDFNGRICKVAAACMHPHVFSLRVLEKYSLKVWLSLEDARTDSVNPPWKT